MADVLVQFSDPIPAEDGRLYMARAIGDEMRGGRWEGWLEFLPTSPADGATPVRTRRETTQPNRTDTEYWATGLTPVYLQGALRRALAPLSPPPVRVVAPPVFDGPAAVPPPADAPRPASVLNPHSVYRKGEALLRRQLASLSGWHLVNIIRDYELYGHNEAALESMEPHRLVEIIIDGVRSAPVSRG